MTTATFMPEVKPTWVWVYPSCPRCGGTGRYYSFGGCFNCNGTGTANGRKRERVWPEGLSAETVAQLEARELTRLTADREARRARKVARADRARAEFFATREGLAEAFAAAREGSDPAASDMFYRLGKFGTLSDAQVAYVFSMAERAARREEREAEEAARAAKGANALAELAESARSSVTGKVVFTKWSEDRGYGSTEKMLFVEDRGFKIWCSVPRALDTSELPIRASFDIALEVSRDDAAFAYGKRPTKVKMEE